MVRCPVCEGTAVTVVLNSKPHASCSSCGAQWTQEGSWQRAIRRGQAKLPLLGGGGSDPLVTLEHADQDVILLPDPIRRAPPPRLAEPPPEEAIAT